LSDNKQRLRLSRAQREKFQRIRRLEQIQQLDPIEFEHFVGYIYQQMGHTVWLTISSGDEGVDLVLRKGRQTIIVQCKRYNGTVGQPVVRDLYGALAHIRANRAILATSGGISRPAEEWARGKPIELLDGHELLTMARRAQAVSRFAWLRNISWPMVGLVLLTLLVLSLAGLSVVWAARVIGERTASQVIPPPPTAAVSNAMTEQAAPPRVTTEPTRALAPTVTLPVDSGQPPPPPTGGPEITAAFRLVPPQIDGRLDDWAGFAVVNTPYIVLQTGGEPAQVASSAWQLGWDDNYLYLAAAVQDDIHAQTQTDPRLAYLGDSLEVQIDVSPDGRVGSLVTTNSWQFIISPGDFGAIPPSLFRFRGNAQGGMADATGHQARVAAAPSSSGYIIEAAIPWSDLAFAPSVESRTLRIALSVNDNDRPGTAAQTLMLSHVPTRQWRNPSSWGLLRLTE
jgi:hypothetical protein